MIAAALLWAVAVVIALGVLAAARMVRPASLPRGRYRHREVHLYDLTRGGR